MNEKITPELMEKAKAAGSPEELLTLAKEAGVELTAEAAQSYYDQFHRTGELSDDELDAVSGGGCHYPDGRLMVSAFYGCEHFCCRRCGQRGVPGETSHTSVTETHSNTCMNCVWATNAATLCNHPANNNKK